MNFGKNVSPQQEPNFVLLGSFAGSQTSPLDNYGLKNMQEWRKN